MVAKSDSASPETGETSPSAGGYRGYKYQDSDFAGYYLDKHERTFIRRLSNERERKIMGGMLEKLAPFDSVLDLPSGAGRFFPTLARYNADMLASDRSLEMLQAGRAYDARLNIQPKRFVTSALQTCLPNKCVDVIFCSRLVHHIPDPLGRVKLLRELARVARKGIVLSFFDARTFKHWRRVRKQRRKGKLGNRHAVTREQMIAEAAEAGLEPIAMRALFPLVAELTASAFRIRS